MDFLNNLNWYSKLKEYSEEERKVLLALSNSKFRWRTKDKIVKTTGLRGNDVDEVLSDLISHNVLKASISKKKNIIFGLIERIKT